MCKLGKGDCLSPNIVLVLADDQCFRAMGHIDDEVITPNIDRLARSGTTFTHAYNMGAWNGAVCVASRAMLITGSFIWDAYRYEDEYRNQDQPLSRPMWGNLMQKAGISMPGSGAGLPVYPPVCWLLTRPRQTALHRCKGIFLMPELYQEYA